jgi:hypothetical protein
MSDFRGRMNSDGSLQFPIYNPPLEYLFGNAVYMKGAWVLHMLRNLIGDEKFEAICKSYFEVYKYQNVNTADFIQISEAVCGISLRTFFNQWLNYGGIPVILGSWKQNNDMLQIYLEQKQDTPEYIFDLELLIRGVIADTILTVPFDERIKEVSLKFSDPVLQVIIDPREKILNQNNGPLYFIPFVSKLVKNFPNPFNENTTIIYQLGSNDNIKIEIYDLLGSKLETLVNEKKNIGVYNTEWSGESVASGVYYCVLKTSKGIDVRKMMLLK